MLDAIRSLIVWTPLGLPAFLFVITTVVFFHELGHFWVARRFGVKVEVFSVGFGGEIFGWTDRLGTRWKISWLPIGGYVKFAGDANAASQPDAAKAESMSEEERKGALLFKPNVIVISVPYHLTSDKPGNGKNGGNGRGPSNEH